MKRPLHAVYLTSHIRLDDDGRRFDLYGYLINELEADDVGCEIFDTSKLPTPREGQDALLLLGDLAKMVAKAMPAGTMPEPMRRVMDKANALVAQAQQDRVLGRRVTSAGVELPTPESDALDINPAQRALLDAYAGGDFKDIASRADLEDCGDLLLQCMMSELATSQGCESVEEAQGRVELALDQIRDVERAISDLDDNAFEASSGPRPN